MSADYFLKKQQKPLKCEERKISKTVRGLTGGVTFIAQKRR